MNDRENKDNLLERGLRWDVGFSRKLGLAAVGLAAGASAIGLPAVATGAAIFAGGSFAGAEIEKRVADDMTKRRLGRQATRENLELAA